MTKKLKEGILRNNMALLEKLALYKLDELYPEIETIRKNHNIPNKETIIPYRHPKNYTAYCKKAKKELSVFFEEDNSLSAFFQQINSVREKTGLGREWNIAFSRLVVSGILLPPPFSVFVYEDEEKGIITFETNKNTTTEDIISAWNYYKETREKMFGKSRSYYTSQSDTATIALIKQLELTKKKEELTDKQVSAYLTESTDESGEDLPLEMLDEMDEKNKNWFKKNRERFKKEVTD